MDVQQHNNESRPSRGHQPSTAEVEVYRTVTEHFRQDIREFWTRSNFYLVVEAGLISVFVASADKPTDATVRLLLAGLGAVLSVFWLVVTWGSVHWINRWREQVRQVEKPVDSRRTFAKAEALHDEKPYMSAQTVTQFVPVLFLGTWIVLIAITAGSLTGG